MSGGRGIKDALISTTDALVFLSATRDKLVSSKGEMSYCDHAYKI